MLRRQWLYWFASGRLLTSFYASYANYARKWGADFMNFLGWYRARTASTVYTFALSATMSLLVGFGALISGPIAFAQNTLLSEEEVYQVARGITGAQSPMFLFSGLEVFGTSVLMGDGFASVALESPTIPDGPNFGNRVIFDVAPVGFGLLEIPVVVLPKRWESGTSQTLVMGGPGGQGPTFKGLWDQSTGGFFSFDLNLGDVSYQGEGIGYQVPELRFTLSTSQGISTLQLDAKRWEADYGGSLDGSEVATGVSIEILAPEDQVSPSALLTLANHLMSSALNIEGPEASGLFDAPVADDLNGLRIKVRLDEAQWETRSPPAVGSLSGAALDVAIDNNEFGLATITIDASLAAMDFGLADNKIAASKPAVLSARIGGLDPRALAQSLYGRDLADTALAALGGQAPSVATDRLTASVAVVVQDMALIVPAMQVDSTIGEVGGGLTLESVSSEGDGEALINLSGVAKEITLPDFVGREGLEPMATNLILPMMPRTATLDLTLRGLETQAVSDAINALAALDIGGVAAAIPSDLSALTFDIANTRLENELVDLSVDGSFRLKGGTIPIRGTINLELGPLFPLQGAIQRSLSTPIPEVVQILSAGIVAMTVLQSYAVPAEGGRFKYALGFEGGLPKINGRELPRLPGF